MEAVGRFGVKMPETKRYRKMTVTSMSEAIALCEGQFQLDKRFIEVQHQLHIINSTGSSSNPSVSILQKSASTIGVSNITRR